MKRFYYFALFLIIQSSCINNIELDAPKRVQTIDSFSVSFEKDSKAVIENGGIVRWGEQDSIWVFSDLESPVKMYRDNADGRFKGRSITGSEFYAYYPSSANSPMVYNESYPLTLRFSNRGFIQGDGIDIIPMVAKSQGDNLVFKQTCGMLHIKLTSSDKLQYLELKGNSNELLATDCSIDLSADTPVLQSGDIGQNRIIVNCPEVLSCQGAWDVYFPLPVCSFSNGLTISAVFCDKDTQEMFTKQVSTSKSIEIQRAQMISMDPVDMDELSQADLVIDNITLQDNVLMWDAVMKEYITIENDNTVLLSKDCPTDRVPGIGDIIYFVPAALGEGMYIGRVTSLSDDSDKFTLHTEMPDVDDVFSQFALNAALDASNTVVIYEHDEEDTFNSVRIVDNSIWEQIETVYSEEVKGKTPTYSTQDNDPNQKDYPIDLTLELLSDNEHFLGKVYVRMTGTVSFSSKDSYAFDVHMRVGLIGTLKIAGVSGGKSFPIIKSKRGIHLYGNNLIGIRFNPILEFFAEGSVRCEAGLKYDIINTEIMVEYEQGEFKHAEKNKLRDYYFRVKSLHSDAALGFRFRGSLYAFFFDDRFLSAGVDFIAGMKLEGEKNTGIQFPELANFDFSIGISPFLSLEPFIAYRKDGKLKREDVEFSVSLQPFTTGLLPDYSIHDQFYNKRSKKISVDASMMGENTAFVETKQGGIALFKENEDEPVSLHPLTEVVTKSDSSISFDITDDAEYYLTPYVETYNDGFVYGEHITVDEEPAATLSYGFKPHFDDWYPWNYLYFFTTAEWIIGNNTHDYFSVFDAADVECQLNYNPKLYQEDEIQSVAPYLALSPSDYFWKYHLHFVSNSWSKYSVNFELVVNNEPGLNDVLWEYYSSLDYDHQKEKYDEMMAEFWKNGVAPFELSVRDSTGMVDDDFLIENVGCILMPFHNSIEVLEEGPPVLYGVDFNQVSGYTEYTGSNPIDHYGYGIEITYTKRIKMCVPGSRIGEIHFFPKGGNSVFYYNTYLEEYKYLRMYVDGGNSGYRSGRDYYIDPEIVKPKPEVLEADFDNSKYIVSFTIYRTDLITAEALSSTYGDVEKWKKRIVDDIIKNRPKPEPLSCTFRVMSIPRGIDEYQDWGYEYEYTFDRE